MYLWVGGQCTRSCRHHTHPCDSSKKAYRNPGLGMFPRVFFLKGRTHKIFLLCQQCYHPFPVITLYQQCYYALSCQQCYHHSCQQHYNYTVLSTLYSAITCPVNSVSHWFVHRRFVNVDYFVSFMSTFVHPFSWQQCLGTYTFTFM